jgi:hypothetical protein
VTQVAARAGLGPTEEFLGTERDNGHYGVHCIWGGLDVNVFSQEPPKMEAGRLKASREDLPPNGDLLL